MTPTIDGEGEGGAGGGVGSPSPPPSSIQSDGAVEREGEGAPEQIDDGAVPPDEATMAAAAMLETIKVSGSGERRPAGLEHMSADDAELPSGLLNLL